MRHFFRHHLMALILGLTIVFAIQANDHPPVDHNPAHELLQSQTEQAVNPHTDSHDSDSQAPNHPDPTQMAMPMSLHESEHPTTQHVKPTEKPAPDEVLQMLKDGNIRFMTGNATYPHQNPQRLFLAGTENQGNHAYATVITCSDSRVPVELIFDAGIMDIFVIRVAGNVCDTDEIGSIEYGLAHVNTPVLVVLGHTQCGAVTAVTHELQGKGHKLEKNIPPLVDNIIPAVQHAMDNHPNVHGDDIIPYAIRENVWQGIHDLLSGSPDCLRIVNDGKAKIVGAIYDVSTGQVVWLPEAPVEAIIDEINHADLEKAPEMEVVSTPPVQQPVVEVQPKSNPNPESVSKPETKESEKEESSEVKDRERRLNLLRNR